MKDVTVEQLKGKSRAKKKGKPAAAEMPIPDIYSVDSAGDEARFRLMFELAPLGYQSLDQAGKIIEVNRAWLAFFGYTRMEVVGRSFEKVLAKEQRPLFRQRFPLFKEAGEVHGVEFEVVKKSGERAVVSFDGVIARNADDSFRRTHCIFHDITEKKARDAELEASERRYRQLFNGSGDAIFIHDMDGRIVDVNDEACTRLGYSRPELLGMSLKELDAPEFCAMLPGRFAKLKKKGRNICETVHVRKDGTRVAVEISARIIEHEGMAAVLAAARDISERKRMEAHLRQSQEKYRVVADNTYDWEYWESPDGILLYVSPACERITGYAPDEMISDPAIMESIVHPEDRKIFNAHKHEALCGNSILEVRFRIMRRGGGERWIGHCCRHVFSETGEDLGIRANNRDITEIILAEESLRRSGEQLRAMSRRLLSAKEAERAALARELHDEMGQLFAAMAIEIEFLKRTLPAGSSSLKSLSGMADELSRTMRGIYRGLRMPADVDTDEAASPMEPASNPEGGTAPDTRLNRYQQTEFSAPPHVAASVYSIFQEAILSAMKHSGMAGVEADCRVSSDEVEICVRDRRAGFNWETVADGFGLAAVKERAALYGGSLAVTSSPEAGTEIKLTIPIDSLEKPSGADEDDGEVFPPDV